VLFLHIRFDIRQREIRGFVALLMDIPSLEELRALIARLIAHISR
jgi:chemotaxis protein CheC